MNDLLSIIRKKDFAGLHTQSQLNVWVMRRDGQAVSAEIPREDDIQRFMLADEEGKTQLPSAVMPFLKWMSRLKPDNSSRIKKAKPSMCVIGPPR